MNISELFWPGSITQTTINGWVLVRPEFNYATMLFATVIILVTTSVLKRQFGLKTAFKRGVLLSFTCTVILHAVVYELIWNRWVQVDYSAFHGKTIENKLMILNGDLYRFIFQCKQIIGLENYSLYPEIMADQRLVLTSFYLQYYLLPSRKISASDYLIVLSDGNIWFDEQLGKLHVGNTVAGNYKLCYKYSSDFYLLKEDK